MTWLYLYVGIGLLLGFLVCFARGVQPASALAFWCALLTLVLFWPVVLIGDVMHARRKHRR